MHRASFVWSTLSTEGTQGNKHKVCEEAAQPIKINADQFMNRNMGLTDPGPTQVINWTEGESHREIRHDWRAISKR